MRVTSVICEYNPFHFGHAYQLSEMKKTGAVIAVMSGSFTQRGSAAVLSKYERARLAVLHGADLVLELPFPFSSSRAELFGMAGVNILHALGCVDELCFGSESGDIDSLIRTENNLSSPIFQAALEEMRKQDKTLSHHAASCAVYAALFGENHALDGSNDLLALSYLAALRKEASSIKPVAIRRIGERYNGEGTGFASATSIRSHLRANDVEKLQDAVPPAVAASLLGAREKGELCEEERLYPLFASLVRTREEQLLNVPDLPSELLSRMKKAAKCARTTEEFMMLAATKSHSPSRIRRGMLYALLNVTENDLKAVPFTTVLAANTVGRDILSSIRKTADIAIITKPADAGLYGENVMRAFSLNARADSIWSLLSASPMAGDHMMKEHPRMI